MCFAHKWSRYHASRSFPCRVFHYPSFSAWAHHKLGPCCLQAFRWPIWCLAPCLAAQDATCCCTTLHSVHCPLPTIFTQPVAACGASLRRRPQLALSNGRDFSMCDASCDPPDSCRTVILVTNQLQYARPADHILYMAGGQITEAGSYEELMAAGGNFAELMKQTEVNFGVCSHSKSVASLQGASQLKGFRSHGKVQAERLCFSAAVLMLLNALLCCVLYIQIVQLGAHIVVSHCFGAVGGGGGRADRS